MHSLGTLPPGLVLERVLQTTERSTVLLVRRGEDRLVLRVADAVERLASEMVLAARVGDPRIIVAIEWGETTDGFPYVLRPFVDGEPLDQAIAGASEERIAGWTAELLAALASLHEAGFVHGDLKAEHVLVRGDSIALIDLDLAGPTQATRGAGGTPFHIAPELLLGHLPGPGADLFSLGATLAFALCGSPDPAFTRQFPHVPFWEAAALDENGLPGSLAPLVRALVRRHPLDRPPSARAAAALLELPRPGRECEANLPLLAGREQVLEEVERRLREAPVGLLVRAADSAEVDAIAEDLQLRLLLAKRPTALFRLGTDIEAGEREPDAPRLAVWGAQDKDANAAAALRWARQKIAEGAACWVLLGPAQELGALAETLRGELLEREAGRFDDVIVPAFDEHLLAEHLLRIGVGATPALAERLARSLMERTQGSLPRVREALASAVAEGVMRADAGGFIYLRDDWPAAPVLEPAHARATLGALSSSARAMLRAAVVLARPVDPRTLRAAAELTDVEAGEAMRALIDAHLLELAREEPGQLRLADPGWSTAALSGCRRAERRRLEARCASALERAGAPESQTAKHRLRAAKSAADFAGVLEVAERERAAGHLGTARRLARETAEALPATARDARASAVVLLARIELAQGDAERGLAELHRAYGAELREAPTRVLLVAAEAEELRGARAAARALHERVLGARPSREDNLRALLGLGYGLLLDGAYAEVLDRTANAPWADDPDEPAGALLNLQAGALAELGREDEALERLEEAMHRAVASGDPTLVGRTELNRGFLHRRMHRITSAVEDLERARAAFHRAENLKMRALAANNAAVLQRDLGQLERAGELLHESLRLRRSIGEAHGIAVTLGNLGLVTLEAGQVGVGLATLEEASRRMARGGYEAERALVDAHRVLALALLGRTTSARALLESTRVAELKATRPVLHARLLAHLELAEGSTSRAAEHLRRALDDPTLEAGSAERFRAACAWAALDPSSPAAAHRLEQALTEVDGGTRRAEFEWLRCGPSDDLDQLRRWLGEFDAQGRTQLVHVVARRLADDLNTAGLAEERRAVMGRAANAVDALTDSVPREEREGLLVRLAQLAGAGTPTSVRPGALGTEWLLAWNQRLAREEDLEALLASTVDRAIECTGARAGFLVMLHGAEIELHVARGASGGETPLGEARFSRSLVREAVRGHVPIVTANAQRDPRWKDVSSLARLEPRVLLCVPLPTVDGIEGALVLERLADGAAFDDFDVAAASSLADQAAIAASHARRQADGRRETARLRDQVEYREREVARMRSLLEHRGGVAPLGVLVGQSPALARLSDQVDRLAASELTVLLTGSRSGGVEEIARVIHERSPRAPGPFVRFRPASLSADDVTEELFGRVRTSLASSARERRGQLAKADRGTLFLDSVEELPVRAQGRLAEALEEGRYRPLGGRRWRALDVRFVVASTVDLAKEVRAGRFSSDLLQHLDGARVRVPSLRERARDIPLLSEGFLDDLNRRYGTKKRFSAEVVAELQSRAWPGDVRELSNEITRLYFLSDARIDRVELVRNAHGGETTVVADAMPASFLLEDVERAAIARALESTRGNKEKAARLLGISRAGLYKKLSRLKMDAGARSLPAERRGEAS